MGILELDQWADRHSNRYCSKCIYYCSKSQHVGRCRRHSPTSIGYPVVYLRDWCGDFKLDEYAEAEGPKVPDTIVTGNLTRGKGR